MSRTILTQDGIVVYDSGANPAPVTKGDPRIPGWIAELRAKGENWSGVAMWLMTQGLQRALTSDEWDVCYAAGMPRQDDPVTPPDPGPDLSGSDLEYGAVRGRPVPVVGVRSFTVHNCPENVQVQVVQASGKTASAFTVVANGITKSWDNLQDICAIDVQGPTVSVAVSTAADSNLQVFLRG